MLLNPKGAHNLRYRLLLKKENSCASQPGHAKFPTGQKEREVDAAVIDVGPLLQLLRIARGANISRIQSNGRRDPVPHEETDPMGMTGAGHWAKTGWVGGRAWQG